MTATERSARLDVSVEDFRPEVIEGLAASVGVVLRPGRPCRSWSVNLDACLGVSCCRSQHSDPWHIDGRWPTVPWREDEIDALLAGAAGIEVSR